MPELDEHTTAGFFSSAKRLALPLGSAFDPAGVRGYPIDMRAKAQVAQWPPGWKRALDAHFVSLIQYGLGCYERFLAGEGEPWLEAAVELGRYLVESQQEDGSWLNVSPSTHTFLLKAPWRCGMAQGEGASLLVRLYLETADERFAESALRALAPLFRPADAGGVGARVNGSLWPEEFPTNPPSLVLNGAVFAWWGVRDVGVGLQEGSATRAFREGMDLLAATLDRFDTGRWSLYCLRPFPVANVSSSFYHLLHITQLEALGELEPRAEFETVRRRWSGYWESAWHRRQALARKVAFRVVVPRHPALASRLPWS
jgi:heparosan-N-sulfate-glucuronate 5-epimerase